jgi:pimeloyl-ACP methyl ester carboxylesterase
VTKAFPPGPGSAEFRQADGFLRLSSKGIHADFAQDLPFSTRNVIYSTQTPWAVRATMTKVTHPAWKTRPSWFIIGIEDGMVPVALARAEAKMIGAATLELHSSHVPMLSQPDKVAAFIVRAAKMLK